MLERQQEQLLAGVPYFLVTFTVPEALQAISRQHQRLLYGMLLRESAATIQDIAAHPKHFGGSLALLGVLHTWTRQLVYHPHVLARSLTHFDLRSSAGSLPEGGLR